MCSFLFRGKGFLKIIFKSYIGIYIKVFWFNVFFDFFREGLNDMFIDCVFI